VWKAKLLKQQITVIKCISKAKIIASFKDIDKKFVNHNSILIYPKEFIFKQTS